MCRCPTDNIPIEKDAAKHGKICSVKIHALKNFARFERWLVFTWAKSERPRCPGFVLRSQISSGLTIGALSKSSLNPGAPYQGTLPSILRMRAENELVRVFWRGVLEEQPLRHPPGPFPPDPGRGCALATGGIPPAAGPIVVRFPKTGKGGSHGIGHHACGRRRRPPYDL
jgi:hypothetical protein